MLRRIRKVIKLHKINEFNVKKIKVGDNVKFRSNLGKVLDKKLINLTWTKYTIFKVEFSENEPIEWINGMYLVKI